jgi:ubiquinone/menaquinone biosynthesis C-methylase UbiE
MSILRRLAPRFARLALPALPLPLSLLAASFVACGPSAHPAPNAAPPASASASESASRHHPLVHRFEKAEEWVSVFDDPARDAWQKPTEVVALMQIASGSTVADLGTGTGYFVPYLSRAVGERGHVLALDIEPDMVRYVKERAAREKLANVEARVVPMDGPGLEAASVDRVLVADTWHHIPERGAYVKKLHDALREGGAVYVVDFTLESKMGPPKMHRLAPEQVVAELTAGGLKAEILKEELPEQYVVRGAR